MAAQALYRVLSLPIMMPKFEVHGGVPADIAAEI